VTAVGAIVTHHGGHPRADAVTPAHAGAIPAGTSVTTPPAPGTKVLTEPVDPAQIAVPEGWQTIPADRGLAAALRALEAGHPSLVVVLRAEEFMADEGAVRLFAYTATHPMAFVAIASFASPGVAPIDPRAVPAVPDKVTRSRGVTTESRAVQLPAGAALQLRTEISTKSFRAAALYDVLVIPTRTIQLYMATEDGTVPPVFSQIETSLRAG